MEVRKGNIMDKYEIPTLKKACEILTNITESGMATSCLEISRETGISRTTVMRILETFTTNGFLAKDGKKYKIGDALIKVGNIASLRSNIGEIAFPYLKKLTDITGETSHIGILSGEKILIAKVCESPLALHAASRAGSLVDIHCSGTGKVLLAELWKKDTSFIKKIKLTKRTQNTLTNIRALQKEIKSILDCGYAIDDEEYHDSIRCLAVPVRYSNDVIASLGITAPAVRFEKKLAPKLYKTVSAVANELAQRIASKI